MEDPEPQNYFVEVTNTYPYPGLNQTNYPGYSIMPCNWNTSIKKISTHQDDEIFKD